MAREFHYNVHFIYPAEIITVHFSHVCYYTHYQYNELEENSITVRVLTFHLPFKIHRGIQWALHISNKQGTLQRTIHILSAHTKCAPTSVHK